MTKSAHESRAALRQVRTFAELFAFLRDELGWPIEVEDFEDAYFEYTPGELGLDERSTAAIRRIRRLRPLSAAQPWGIYFIDFEEKRLPVVALRRVLSRVVLKKRASANSDESAAWAQDDLLFISAHGDAEARHITFAQFSDPSEPGRLPVLKVLGWDDRDSALHLDAVSATLRDRLAWPDDDRDTEGWRQRWRSAFTLRHREVITTSQELARRLADLATGLRSRVETVLGVESAEGQLTRLMTAFRATFIDDLAPDDFADMYAQTIAYGMLSNRIANPRDSASLLSLGRGASNPFLTGLLEEFLRAGAVGRSGPAIDFDELGVNDIVELLDEAHMEAVLRDFGDRNPNEDPVIHFYEVFLREYDPGRRMQRGVFYTPIPIVSFIVRSVDAILRSEFGLADGLADTSTWRQVADRTDGFELPDSVDPEAPFVQVLDPATGTGTFLVEVIDLVYRTMRRKWLDEGMREVEVAEAWAEYVPSHLLPRLYGFELLMAPYAIAHMKVGLKLAETGYVFSGSETQQIFLTNALEPPLEPEDHLETMAPALADEARAVKLVKESARFTVVVGNPPYSKSSANRSPAAEALVAEFKRLVAGEKNVQPLSDDYVKFLAYATQVVDAWPSVIGMITNHSYFSGLIHRGMRARLLESFDDIRVADLHGDTNVGEHPPPGIANENVFDITQGVGVSLISRRAAAHGTRLEHVDLWGTRSEKFAELDAAGAGLDWKSLDPVPPYYFFSDLVLEEASEGSVGLDDLFPVKGMGIKTRRDHFLLALERDELVERFEMLADARDVEVVRPILNVSDNAQWSLEAMRDLVREEGVEAGVREINYRPFDRRWIWYHRRAIERGDARWPVMKHVNDTSICLLSSRQTTNALFSSALVVRGLSEMKTAESTRGSYAFPIHLHEETLIGESENLNRSLLGPALRDRDADDVLAYVYAVLYSRSFRSAFRELLRKDYPQVPVDPPSTVADGLISLGHRLVSAHLLEATGGQSAEVSFLGDQGVRVTKVGYEGETAWIDPARSRGFSGIPVEVWEYEIGGYQVLEKWLKERCKRGGKRARPGTALSADDIVHFCKVAEALAVTIATSAEIDEVVDSWGFIGGS